jgi:hypothetical protein
MSKLGTRIALSVLISLAVILGLYSTVSGASNEAGNRAGSHLVSGAKVNLDHYRQANPAPAPLQSDFQPGKGHGGGGCESERYSDPDL